MLIKSPAGEFPITIDRFEIEGNELVIVGKMGVWDARTHVEARDFLRIFGKLFLLLFAQWIGSIKSHAILGGLHHHYVRV